MTSRHFARPDIYKALFDPDDSKGVDELVADLLSSAHDAIKNLASKEAPLRVLSVGFGAGRLDLPFIDGLAQHARNGISAVLVEPDWGHGYGAIAQDILCARRYSPSNKGVCFEKDSTVLEVVPTTIEELFATHQFVNRWDIILCLFSIHLLTDWKSSLSSLLNQLNTGGILVLGENFNSVTAIEGAFCPPKQTTELTPWETLWQKIYEVRDNLLIPRSRIATPSSQSIVHALLEKSQFIRHSSKKSWDRKVSASAITQLVKDIEGGCDAHSFGSLRIDSRSEATVFAERATKIIQEFHDTTLEYKLGITLNAFVSTQEPISESDRYATLATIVTAEMCKGGTYHYKLIKNHLSQKVAEETGTQEQRQGRALYNVLYSMRDNLLLSKNSWTIFNARATGQGYTTALTLLPSVVLGNNETHSWKAFLSLYSLYVAGDPKYHLSRLLEPDQMSILRDIAILIRFPPSDHIRPKLSFHESLTSDLRLESCTIDLPTPIFQQKQKADKEHWDGLISKWIDESNITQFLKDYNSPGGSKPYLEWNNITNLRYYVMNDSVGGELLQLLDRECAWIRDHIEKRIAGSALLSLYPKLEQSPEYETLVNVLSHAMRLCLFTEPSMNRDQRWSSLLLLTNSSSYLELAPISTGCFLILTENDDRFVFQSATKGPNSDLLSATLPWKSLFYDMFMSYYAAIEAIRTGRHQILHHLPFAVTDAFKYLREHETAMAEHAGVCKTSPSFRMPAILFEASLMAAIYYAEKGEKDVFLSALPNLDDEETLLKTKGFSRALFMRLMETNGLAMALARIRCKVLRDAKVHVDTVITGNDFVLPSGLCDEVSQKAIMGLLLLLLKESIQHAALFAYEKSESRSQVHVIIKDNAVRITNDYRGPNHELTWRDSQHKDITALLRILKGIRMIGPSGNKETETWTSGLSIDIQ